MKNFLQAIGLFGAGMLAAALFMAAMPALMQLVVRLADWLVRLVDGI